METKLNLKALLAASAYVCKLNRGEIPEIALIKILYEAERSAITYSLYSITGDSFETHKKGPVLTHLLTLIRGTNKALKRNVLEWNKFFELKDKKTRRPMVSLKKLPDMDEISQMDKRYLDDAFVVYSKFLKDDKETNLVHFAHKRYKEWKSNGASIKRRDILMQTYKDSSKLDELVAEVL